MHYGPYLEILCERTFRYDRKKDEAGLSDSSLNLDIPLGPNGGDSRMVLDYLSYRRFHKPIPAGVLLLNCGLHDIKRESQLSEPKISLASYKKNLRASLQVAKEMNLHVVWVNTTPVCDAWHNSGIVNFFRFSKDVDAFNAAANEVMKREHIPVIDLHRFTMTLLPDGLQDHVHYSETARSRQARFLFDELRQILKLGLHEIVSA